MQIIFMMSTLSLVKKDDFSVNEWTLFVRPCSSVFRVLRYIGVLL